MVCLPNDHLLGTAPEGENLAEIFARSDEMLGVGVRALWAVLAQTGVVNLDFASVRSLVEESEGLCWSAHGAGAGADKAAQAIEAVLQHPLLADRRMLGDADRLLVEISGGADLSLTDMDVIMRRVKAAGRPHVHIMMGAAIDPHRVRDLTVTLLLPWHPGGRRRARDTQTGAEAVSVREQRAAEPAAARPADAVGLGTGRQGPVPEHPARPSATARTSTSPPSSAAGSSCRSRSRPRDRGHKTPNGEGQTSNTRGVD